MCMTNSLTPIRMALVAFVLSISIFAAFAAPAMADTHPVPACGKNLLPNNKHCTAPAPTPVAEVLLVTSPAPCTVLIEGTSLADFNQVLLDFDSLIVTEAGFSSYLAVYPPGDVRNLGSTSVSVGGNTSITISNPAICGKNLIVTTALFQDSTVGSSYYETVAIQA